MVECASGRVSRVLCADERQHAVRTRTASMLPSTAQFRADTPAPATVRAVEVAGPPGRTCFLAIEIGQQLSFLRLAEAASGERVIFHMPCVVASKQARRHSPEKI
eukprot:COSAG01_NODE_13246_length_1613_cov_1.658520_2_plen_105_part_00